DNSRSLFFDEDEEPGINRKAQWVGLENMQAKDFFLPGFLLSFLITLQRIPICIAKERI
ncbi:hypothetical protein HPP92_006292, partial [Vanilla planifolia]